MSALRFSAAIILTLTGLLAAFIPIVMMLAANERITQDREYLDCFARAATEFKHRSPSGQRVAPLGCPEIGTGANYLQDKEGRETLGVAPPGGLALSFWRGEWFEYYAAWSGETTLLASHARYWRAFALECALGILIALASFTGAVLLLRAERRSPRWQESVEA